LISGVAQFSTIRRFPLPARHSLASIDRMISSVSGGWFFSLACLAAGNDRTESAWGYAVA
jgi:hypothetical protein